MLNSDFVKKTHCVKIIHLFLCVIIAFTTIVFWEKGDPFFYNGDSVAISMVAAGKHNLNVSGRKYGLAFVNSVENVESFARPNSRAIYADPSLWGGKFLEYRSQVGLHGWVFYYFAKFIPHPLPAFQLGSCLLLSLVLTLICYELYKKYGLLFSTIFYIVSLNSTWIANLSTNLFFVMVIWFIPMLLGLICLNNLDKRKWLYPLFFLTILINSLCGYEFITTVMLGSIMFLVVEWICSIRKDKKYSKTVFITIFIIGIISLMGFTAAILIHSYLRGDGDILSGLNNIYHEDVLRRTFGNASDFHEGLAESLNASIFITLKRYLWFQPTGKHALYLLIASICIFFYKHAIKRNPLNAETWLFISSFLTCISWFVLAKSHSYVQVNFSYVLWYMGYMQVGAYIVIKAILQIVLSDKIKIVLKPFMSRFLVLSDKLKLITKSVMHRLRAEINLDVGQWNDN